MVIGDSVAFTVRYYSGPPPAGIASIDGRAVIGCGLLAAAGYYHPANEGGFEAFAGGNCRRQAEAERIGLRGRPDVVVQMPGAWEGTAARSPDGRVIDAQGPEMKALLVETMLRRAAQARAVAARTAIVQWSCPGPATAPVRRDPRYVRWINEVIDATAAEGRARGLDVSVIRPNPAVCVGGDPLGAATPEKNRAMADEVHVVDGPGGRWLWSRWLGPALTNLPRPAR